MMLTSILLEMSTSGGLAGIYDEHAQGKKKKEKEKNKEK